MKGGGALTIFFDGALGLVGASWGAKIAPLPEIFVICL